MLDQRALFSSRANRAAVQVSAMPTVLRIGPYRFYFYSHEPNEPPHIHVDQDDLAANFWIDPVGMARNLGISDSGPESLRSWPGWCSTTVRSSSRHGMSTLAPNGSAPGAAVVPARSAQRLAEADDVGQLLGLQHGEERTGTAEADENLVEDDKQPVRPSSPGDSRQDGG